ncbi:unnamed protein product, partial [Rotaria magnacalcarata]
FIPVSIKKNQSANVCLHRSTAIMLLVVTHPIYSKVKNQTVQRCNLQSSDDVLYLT